MTALVPILISTILGVAGQLLLKQGMLLMGAQTLSPGAILPLLWNMATSPYVVGGLLVYGAGTFFWLVALSRVSLSFAYPFASLSYVLMVAASWLLFNERITLLRCVGVLIICLGVLLVAQSYRETPLDERPHAAAPAGAPNR